MCIWVLGIGTCKYANVGDIICGERGSAQYASEKVGSC